MGHIHVIPENDLIAHPASEDCICGPDVEFVDGGAVVVHHSLDGREFAERGEEVPHGSD